MVSFSRVLAGDGSVINITLRGGSLTADVNAVLSSRDGYNVDRFADAIERVMQSNKDIPADNSLVVTVSTAMGKNGGVRRKVRDIAHNQGGARKAGEFNGCVHHGHECRYSPNQPHPMSKVLYGELRKQFNTKVEILVRAYGLDVEVMWECEREKYPVGHPQILFKNIRPLEECYGLVKATVHPPRKLLHPVLPHRCNALIQWCYSAGDGCPTRDINVFLRAFTAAHARLELDNLMDGLGDRLLYSNTDRVIVVSRDGDWEAPLGPYLGDLDEIGGDDSRVLLRRAQDIRLPHSSR
ncbi:hypothetical protein SRHO_G00100220 [Serrasalmus rhombeus]